ncbi:MAG TPA: hypothetical protein GX503_01855 [Clostridiales bacterium]|nr:hypothetical protein [Clostridiales bacterium]
MEHIFRLPGWLKNATENRRGLMGQLQKRIDGKRMEIGASLHFSGCKYAP